LPRSEILSEVIDFLDEVSLVVSIEIEGTVAKTVIDIETLVKRMRATGASDKAIREVLLNDLNQGGRIFGSFKNQFKATSDFAVGRMSTYGELYEYGKAGVEEWKWFAKDVDKACPDCQGRHGDIGSYEEWEEAGMPQSGFSICGLHCKCKILPTGSWVDKPEGESGEGEKF
jgi:hypothetical protein